MASNNGPLFVAYDNNNAEAGRLTVNSSGVTLQLYGVEAMFSMDFTGRFRQFSICVHDGEAQLYEDCNSEGSPQTFIVSSTDIIRQLSFGQAAGASDDMIFQVYTYIYLIDHHA